ncbi:unnamed protein product [Phyllotreta striolata]|uniref:protein xylosyltransferase n=1 Tax=Phyllotreta striolata TaxID=444603 RepID=A0A9N9TR90_PHYSR|nr:unnamed protein product [Phyllotreta striolata]
MVKGNSSRKNGWMRIRYRTFFVVGILILSFQILLAVKFLSINNINKPSDDQQVNELPLSGDLDGSNKNIKAYESFHNLHPNPNSNNNNTHSLKYEDLDFTPVCHINAKEAVSAINRAKTQYCKYLLANITCLSEINDLYPKKLKSTCSSVGVSAGADLGCYKDERNFRLLSGYYKIDKKENSPQHCTKLCLQSGFPYAGVQYGSECFCGADEPPQTSKVPDSSCNFKCPGDVRSTCGGYYTMNVYHTGIKKFVPQNALTDGNVTNGTKETAKIAFLLTLNGRALRQVKRLLKILYHKDHYYYIHVDIRQDYLYRELLKLENSLPNIRLTRNRFATIWGGASLLQMLTSCMRELLNIDDWKWDFVINLSESDFPVKPVTALARFLAANRNRNFVKSHGRETQRFIQKQGLDKTFVECEHRMWRIGDRILPSGIQLDGGSDWVALSRNFVRYVSRTRPDADELIAGLLRIFKHTLLPAESFFHTALRNSIFCDTYIDNNLHVTNWKRKLGCKCQYKHVVDWCGCSPNDFRPDDWFKIQNTLSKRVYFARKFEPIINQAVVLKLELWLYGLDKPNRNVSNLLGYWESVWHRNDLDALRNDGLLTLSNSARRNLIHCDTSVELKLVEITSYLYNDSYLYTLFKFEYNTSNNASSEIEVAVEPKRQRLSLVRDCEGCESLTDDLDSLVIGSDYDQKERICRNFAGVLSAYSEPVLAYSFKRWPDNNEVYNLSALWIGPDGELYGVGAFSVDGASLVGHSKSGLQQPILPGIWTVKVLHKNAKVAQLEFPILPMESYNGQPVDSRQLAYLNGGSKYSGEKFYNEFGKFLPSAERRRSRRSASLRNTRKIGEELWKWSDELVSGFYEISKRCVDSESMEMCGEIWENCRRTNWSSLADDPKSAIRSINEATGSFDIW